MSASLPVGSRVKNISQQFSCPYMYLFLGLPVARIIA